MPKYLLVLRKTLFFLKPRSSTISLGSSRVCSRAEATWHPMPPLKSLIGVSSIRGSPPSMGTGGWISPFSAPQLGAWLTFCCFAARWASSSLVGRNLPVSTTFLPFYSLLLLGSTCSTLERKVDGGARGGDFYRGGESLGWADFSSPPFLGWFSINSNRFFWVFLWMSISSSRLLGDGGWLNTSNSSMDSVRSTKSCSSCSSCPSSSSWRMGDDDDTPAKRVATESDLVDGVCLGSVMPSGTTNPS